MFFYVKITRVNITIENVMDGWIILGLKCDMTLFIQIFIIVLFSSRKIRAIRKLYMIKCSFMNFKFLIFLVKVICEWINLQILI